MNMTLNRTMVILDLMEGHSKIEISGNFIEIIAYRTTQMVYLFMQSLQENIYFNFSTENLIFSLSKRKIFHISFESNK
jgi:hypothetical protein